LKHVRSPSGCGRAPDHKETYLSDLPLNRDERACLAIIRQYFQCFAAPASMGWLAAQAEADAHFGPEQGPVIAARCLMVLQAVRRARRSTFMFSSPTCPGCAAIATEHERRLVLALHGMRRSRPGEARLEALLLCEGNRIEPVLWTLESLADALDRGATAPNPNPHPHAVLQ